MLRQDEEVSSHNTHQQSSSEMMLYQLLYEGLNPNLRLPAPVTPTPAVQEANLIDLDSEHRTNPVPTAEELARQAVEEKRRQEEEQREWIKHQHQVITQEEQNEKFRCKDFDDHVYLVTQGEGQSYEFLKNRIGALRPLAEPIPRFDNTFKQGLPRRNPQYGGQSLFDTVLLNPNLTSANKFELIVLLFDLGYNVYYTNLLVNPLVQYVVQDDSFNLLLEHLYFWVLRDKKIQVDSLVESSIWKKLIAISKGCMVFDVLLETANSDFRKLFDFINTWMEQMESPDEIIKRCEYMEKAIISPQLMQFIPDIFKIGKLRVFDIVIERIRDNREQYDEYLRAPDPDGILTRALNFLNTHRKPLFKGGFGTTKSSTIYDTIPRDIDLASQLHNQEKTRFSEYLAEKLDQNGKFSLLSYFKL
jgi:hypothetical protein